MYWVTFFIAAYAAVALELALGGYIHVAGASPDLLLPLAVFICMNARRPQALLGAVILGIFQDLFSSLPLGLHAFAYGLSGLFVVSARPSVHRDHPLTCFAMTLAAAAMVGAVTVLNQWAYPRIHRLGDFAAPSVAAAAYRAAYTAFVAPLIMAGLSKARRLFGFRPEYIFGPRADAARRA